MDSETITKLVASLAEALGMTIDELYDALLAEAKKSKRATRRSATLSTTTLSTRDLVEIVKGAVDHGAANPGAVSAAGTHVMHSGRSAGGRMVGGAFVPASVDDEVARAMGLPTTRRATVANAITFPSVAEVRAKQRARMGRVA
jgi:hypothetical protein